MPIFKKSKPKQDNNHPQPTWKVLLVDDEPEVHNVSRLALGGFEFEGQGIELLSAYSGAEGREVLAQHPDIALAFVDVVMETDDSGLRLVQHIREDLNNKFIRLILRTGQPGTAPERDIIVNYDINDYREKTSFDSTKLYTATYAGLRAYRDIMRIEESRKHLDEYRVGLEKAIDSASRLLKINSLDSLYQASLEQLSALLHTHEQQPKIAFMVRPKGNDFEVLHGINWLQEVPQNIATQLKEACVQEKDLFDTNTFIGYFPTKHGHPTLIYMDNIKPLKELDRRWLEVTTSRITIALDNLYLNREIVDTQMEIIETLGEVVETRSKETANHVKRVSLLSKMLAIKCGLGINEANALYVAAPMHDIGKIAIPDSILLKPGKLEADEWLVMKTHAEIGANIFARSDRPTLKAASIIAGQHHEKYDGSGYPSGLKGEEIHIFGRIVAITDVFDALVHKRCYKDAWPLEKVIDLLKEEKGKHLDPNLVDIFLDNLDEVKKIIQAHPD